MRAGAMAGTIPVAMLDIQVADDELLQAGDELLFCGTESGERLLSASANNAYTLEYLVTGTEPARGYIFRWLENARGKPAAGTS